MRMQKTKNEECKQEAPLSAALRVEAERPPVRFLKFYLAKQDLSKIIAYTNSENYLCGTQFAIKMVYVASAIRSRSTSISLSKKLVMCVYCEMDLHG
jgi:hypothetical protein